MLNLYLMFSPSNGLFLNLIVLLLSAGSFTSFAFFTGTTAVAPTIERQLIFTVNGLK